MIMIIFVRTSTLSNLRPVYLIKQNLFGVYNQIKMKAQFPTGSLDSFYLGMAISLREKKIWIQTSWRPGWAPPAQDMLYK